VPFRLRLTTCSRWVSRVGATSTARQVGLAGSLVAVAIVASASAETNSPPSDQVEFLAAVKAGRAAYAQTSNDIAKAAATRPGRERSAPPCVGDKIPTSPGRSLRLPACK
jgi:hypothetical protein